MADEKLKQNIPTSPEEEAIEEPQITGEVKKAAGEAANKAIVEPAKALAQKATQAVVTAARQAVAAAAKWVVVVAIPFIMANLGWIAVAVLAIIIIVGIVHGVISFFYPSQIPSPTGKTIAGMVDPLNPSHFSYQDGVMGRYGFPVEADTELAKAIATLANSQIGRGETAGGCGPLEYYPNKRCPSDPKARPWCADFVSWVITNAGGRIRHLRSARGVENYYKFAGTKQVPRWSSTPAVGDAYTATRTGGSGRHTGIVVAVNGGTITVTDGNWSNKVSRYNRSASSAVGFGVPYK